MKQSRKIQNVAISFHLRFLSSANQMLVGCSVGLIFLPYRLLSASDYNFDSVCYESRLQ